MDGEDLCIYSCENIDLEMCKLFQIILIHCHK